MSLSPDQRQAIIDEARRRGLDEAKLLAAAERLSDEREKQDAPPTEEEAPAKDVASKGKTTSASSEARPLYQYHLSFVTVNEVREVWLGLPPRDDGDEIASVFAAQQLARVASAKADATSGAASPVAESGSNGAGPDGP